MSSFHTATKRARGLLGAAALATLGMLSVAQAAPVSQFNDLTAAVGAGFGNPSNRYVWSLTRTDSGALLVGTKNVGPARDSAGKPLAGGAELWRRDAGAGPWQKVLKAPKDTTGFRGQALYQGQLYAATEGNAGLQLYRSANDGLTWSLVNDGPGSDPQNTSIRTFAELDGLLYTGTENASGGQLWRYDGTTWTRVTTVPDISIAVLSVFQGQLYAGTWNSSSSLGLYLLSGNALVNITPTRRLPKGNAGVMRLQEFNGQFYLTTSNYWNGFAILRSATPAVPGSWQLITDDGFGNPENTYGWSTAIHNGVLYLGTYTDDTVRTNDVQGKGSLYYTTTGNPGDWHLQVSDGFGFPYTWGVRNLLSTPEGLLLGTATDFYVSNREAEPYGIGCRLLLGQ